MTDTDTRARIARTIHEEHGIPEHVARSAYDLAAAAFARAMKEGRAFIQLEEDRATRVLASTLFVGIMQTNAEARSGACALSFMALGMKYRADGEAAK